MQPIHLFAVDYFSSRSFSPCRFVLALDLTGGDVRRLCRANVERLAAQRRATCHAGSAMQLSGTLTQKQIRRGAHRSTSQLERAIREYLRMNNDNPKPFVWTKSADEILESVARFCRRTSGTGH